MKVHKGVVTNFGSYKHLEFDFSNLGLALVFGKSGGGKSTIPDMVSWTLFGVTAKDGAADDVRSWLTPDDTTTSTLSVGTPTGAVNITRIRGKATQNDLYWTEASGEILRGKDLNDTQKLLNTRLGVCPDLYLIGAYFHEFSSTGLFFTSKAKDRRSVFEKIAGMDLAVRLGESSSLGRKVAKRTLDEVRNRAATQAGRRDGLVHSSRDSKERGEEFERTILDKTAEYETKSNSFEKTKAEKIQALELKVEHWDKDKNSKVDALADEIEALTAKFRPINHGLRDLEEELEDAQSHRCSKCGGPDKADHAKELQKTIDKVKKNIAEQELINQKRHIKLNALEALVEVTNPYVDQLVEARRELNTYVERIAEEKKKPNPFKAQTLKLEKELEGVVTECHKFEVEIVTLEARISNLTRLYDLSFELRGEMLKQAVQSAQDSTNRYLEKYFDSEIRIGFALEGADDLTVSIQKSGYECVYKQLSRGQRAVLRMAFVVSIMKAAANKAGIHFDNLFFDEILDGMDGALKIKAFAMLEELSLEHTSILVIDHDVGFQNLFTKRFQVTMDADLSHIEELNE